MPAKKNTSKSRVSNRAKKSGFKFHWWMGVVIVVIIAVVGIIVIRFSHASGSINLTAGILQGGTPNYQNTMKGQITVSRTLQPNFRTTAVWTFLPGHSYQVCTWAHSLSGPTQVWVGGGNKLTNGVQNDFPPKLYNIDSSWQIYCNYDAPGPNGGSVLKFSTPYYSYKESYLFVQATNVAVEVGSIVVYP